MLWHTPREEQSHGNHRVSLGPLGAAPWFPAPSAPAVVLVRRLAGRQVAGQQAPGVGVTSAKFYHENQEG